MNIHFAPAGRDRRVRIKVIGVGGAGGNAVNRMIENGLPDVDFYAINTDSQALEASRAHQTVVIGNRLTRGLGAGGHPEIGRQAAEEDRDLLAALVEDADMVFVTAGMGGGTGTGAAPLVAEAARAGGALTVAVVTRPFAFEGARRMAQAEAGLVELRQRVDALLVIPNERLMEIDVPDSGMMSVFQLADNVLYEATRGISDIIAQHAVVNLDFADVRTVMQDSGAAIMGTGRASGVDRARVAAEQAICSPLLEDVDIHGSRAVLVYLTAACVTRDDLRDAMGHVQQAAGSEAHIFFGFAQDESLGEDLRITVIATGFPAAAAAGARVQAAGSLPDPVADQPEAADAQAEPPVDHGLDEPPSTSEAALPAAAAGSIHATPVPERPEPAVAPSAEAAPLEDAVVLSPAEAAPAEDAAVAPSAEAASAAAVDRTAEPSAPASAPSEAPPAAAAGAQEPKPPAAELSERRAALAAAAGGVTDHLVGRVPATGPAGGVFLEPLGSVKLPDEAAASMATGARFRETPPGEDMLRPAWERKYVD